MGYTQAIGETVDRAEMTARSGGLLGTHSELADAVKNLAQSVTILEEHIDSILRPAEKGDVTAMANPVVSRSYVHSQAADLLEQVEYVTAHIRVITERVDL